MLLTDVNVIVYAIRHDLDCHRPYRAWFDALVQSDESFGMSELVLSSVLRILTNPRIYKKPTPILTALQIIQRIREQPNCVMIQPGPRHWDIFVDLCRKVKAQGNLIPDAYLAALAIESGCEWITTDRDYALFPGLRWRHPLED